MALQNIRIDDLIGLKDCLAAFGRGVLFRGQTEHFGSAEQPSATTSFARHGCIPSEMLRWSRYADEVIGAFTGRYSDFALNQAILQHYGFRSFYLDCSNNPAVSAWFAGNRYSDKLSVELCEDCDERPLFLRKKMARYDPADGVGHLYVLDRAACEKVGLIDLRAISIESARTRPSVQNAHLIGPLGNAPLSAECFLAHIEADHAVFREFAAEAGLVSTDSAFPPSSEDPILDALLSLPWIPIQGVAIGAAAIGATHQLSFNFFVVFNAFFPATGDTFATDRDCDALKSGDLAVFRTAGAYGATMASSYNSRGFVAEVLVDGDKFAVVADRIMPHSIMDAERVPEWL